MSSNETVIVLADINAVKAERDRIYNSNKAALAKQEERLNAEITKNQKLLNKMKKQEAEYNTVLAELENARKQLESFNDAKLDLEGKIDSLSNNLSRVDYVSLSSDEQSRIDKEKTGEWIDSIVDEVISKLGANLNEAHSKELNEFENLILGISDEYYQKFIKDNQAFAIDFFADCYYGFLQEAINGMKAKKEQVLDRILDKIIEEDLDEMLTEHVKSCREQWKPKGGADVPMNTSHKPSKTLESAKADFLSWALYPDKENALLKVARPIWDEYRIDEGLLNTLIKAYPQYYSWCKEIADKDAAKYKNLTNDEILNYEDEQLRVKALMAITDSIRGQRIKKGKDASWPYYAFVEVLDAAAVKDALEPLRTKYNALIDAERNRVEKTSFARIETKIPAISAAKHNKNTMRWESSKYAEEYKDEYAHLRADYPEYTVFLTSLVMQFMQPIITKYDCDEALYVWKSSMEDDVWEYCFCPFRDYQDKLSNIPNVLGSDDKCFNIVRAITEIEKEKIVVRHNERLDRYNKRAKNEEVDAIKQMKKNLQGKTGFDSEEDVIAFLATHKFVDTESEITIWYDSKITKWYMDYGNGSGHYDISYTIVEWNQNSAKLKLNTGAGAPVIVKIHVGSNSDSYSETIGGDTRNFSVVDK